MPKRSSLLPAYFMVPFLTSMIIVIDGFFQVAPMSMHASFGVEAVPLRDAFVSRLRTLTEVLINSLRPRTE